MTIYYVNGSYQSRNNASISVEDRGFNFSDGVYEVIGFTKQKLLNFKKHTARLKRSLNGLKISSPFKNFKSLELIILNLISLNYSDDGFVYLQITRGSAKRNHLFPNNVRPNVVIFTFSNKDIKNLIKGVRVGISEDLRWLRCDIKSISLLPNVLEKQKASNNGLYEIWQCRNNQITEGSTSNAFIINSKNEILTHPSNNFILGGVTRDCVIELARSNGFIVKENSFSIDDIKKCKEAFLTSTTVGVLPVIKIDKFVVNGKKPGKITLKIMDLYKSFLKKQIK